MQNKRRYMLSILIMGLLLTSVILPNLIQSINIEHNQNDTIKNKVQSNKGNQQLYSTIDDWNYYKIITISHEEIETTLTNFPFLISIQDEDLKEKAQCDGDDIIFINDSGTKLHHEIELYNHSTGDLIAWVNITNLSSLVDTEIYMYYGNPNCDNQQNKFGVWDSDYVMVHHLNETDDILIDSTGFQNNGVSKNTFYTTEGKINGAHQYNAYGIIGVTNFNHMPQSLTAECWMYRNSSELVNIFNKGTTSDSCDWSLYMHAPVVNDALIFGINNNSESISTEESVPQQTWCHLVVSYENGNVTLYLNGTALNSSIISSPINNNFQDLSIGNCNDFINPWSGKLDEVRISKNARSACWIQTSYKNMNDPNTFYVVGEEQVISQAPEISDPLPADGETGVSPSLEQLWFNITDPQNDLMNFSVETKPDIGSVIETEVSTGRYCLNISNLEYEKNYVWYVNVTDYNGSASWTNESFCFTTKNATISVEITQPQDDSFYLRNMKLFGLSNKTFIYGPITIVADVVADADIDRVEFYVQGQLGFNETVYVDEQAPYEYNWSPLICFEKTIKVVAYDSEGNTATDEIVVFKWRAHPVALLAAAAFIINPDTKVVRSLRGDTVIRGFIFNPKQQGNTLTFRALRLHYTKVKLLSTESGVLVGRKCSIKTNSPDVQLSMGPFGKVYWIYCIYKGTSLEQPRLFQLLGS